jgi:hypothetical protein
MKSSRDELSMLGATQGFARLGDIAQLIKRLAPPRPPHALDYQKISLARISHNK